ncbi:DUF1711-domain-containing protein [Hyphopichia burtonii NRRL Y-1933]|uniref:DUF1711-domain-containing protein n=1 Tax=Hyphopichia burtonii NRRL Y-1933 TaxID=984485 RepID=A0A1E4RR36_9ASCO|nr:DUF1711-domain-containing protein [Hyphopichia burtonii NRRL Y-1933]ODV69525.1 DUF1711-domain-containing protein [Hyphopichia burtonii NRRL Y-1933]
MAPPKRYWAKLKVPSEFLKTLPEFPPPISKSRLKKLAAEERRALAAASQSNGSSAGASKAGSPTPSMNESIVDEHDGNDLESSPVKSHKTNPALALANQNNAKINSGVKEMSTAGLTMNSANSSSYALDKSGTGVRKWKKGPRQFKTFSGFKVTYSAYRTMPTSRSKPEKLAKAIKDKAIKNETIKDDLIKESSSGAATPVN